MPGYAQYPAILYRHVGAKRSRDVTVEKFNTLGDELEATQTTLGENPHLGYTTVAARFAGIESALVNIQGALINLTTTNNSAIPATRIDIACDLIAIEGQLVSDVQVTIDATVPQAINGRDNSTLAQGWYYLYLGWNPLLAQYGGLISIKPTRGELTWTPPGYTKWRRVGAVYYTGAIFYRYNQVGCEVQYDYEPPLGPGQIPTAHTVASNVGTAGLFVPSNLGKQLPATAVMAWVQAILHSQPPANSSSYRSFRVMRYGGANTGGVRLSHDLATVAGVVPNVWVPLSVDQQFYAGWNGAPYPGASVAIDVLGFRDPVG